MEKRFLLSQKELNIPCVLSCPDSGDVRRVVLGVHGFGGSAADPIQEGIAEEMALFRAATLRFDFPAHGESPMDSEAFTLENCVATLLAVAAYAKAEFPEVEDLCVFATGFGAYVTLVALPDLLEMPGKVKLVMQTPSVRMHETLLSMIRMSRETFWAMNRVTLPAPRPFDVTYSFYEELQEQMVYYNHHMPMLLLHGELDDVVTMEYLDPFRRFNPRSKLVVIPGADHQFRGAGQWDMVVDLTRDWFQCEQVLLCDYL